MLKERWLVSRSLATNSNKIFVDRKKITVRANIWHCTDFYYDGHETGQCCFLLCPHCCCVAHAARSIRTANNKMWSRSVFKSTSSVSRFDGQLLLRPMGDLDKQTSSKNELENNHSFLSIQCLLHLITFSHLWRLSAAGTYCICSILQHTELDADDCKRPRWKFWVWGWQNARKHTLKNFVFTGWNLPRKCTFCVSAISHFLCDAFN